MAILINGQRIGEAVLQSEFGEIKTYFERLGNVSCCERDEEFRGYARQNVVARVLLAQEAKRRLPPTPDADVESAVEQLMKSYGGDVQFYAATGASPSQMDLVRHDVEADLRVKRLMDELCADLRPGDEDLRAFYAQHRDSYMTDEQVRASHILKAPKRGEERKAAFDALCAARLELLKGADFDEAARRESDKAAEHIDLNYFKRGELPEEFEAVAFSMQVGEVSPVFLSTYGFHVMKLTDRIPAEPKPFEAVREELLGQYVEVMRQERAKLLVDSLQPAAVIEEVADEAAPVM